MTSRRAMVAVAGMVLLVAAACATNKLASYKGRVHRVVLLASGQPNIMVQLGQTEQGQKTLTGSITQMGAAAVTVRTRAKLTGAISPKDMQEYLLGEFVRFMEGSNIEFVRPENGEGADARLNLHLAGYGVMADTPETRPELTMTAKADMRFLAEDKLIWDTTTRVDMPLDPARFYVHVGGSVQLKDEDKINKSVQNLAGLGSLTDAQVVALLQSGASELAWKMAREAAEGLR